MLGWRVAFWVCGILGMVYALPLATFLKDAPNPSADHAEEIERKENVFSWSHFAYLFRNLSFLLLVLYFTLPAMAAWVVRDWMPAILKQEFELSQTRAGIAATVSWQLAAIVGVLMGGALADHWSRTQPRGRIFISAIGVSLIAPAIFGVGNAPYLWVAVVFLVVFGIGWGFFDGNNMPILSQIVPPKLLATGYGIMNFVSISCGGFADWGFGILRDQNIPLNVIFGIFAFIALGSIIPVLLIRPR
jgi:MFS family permease